MISQVPLSFLTGLISVQKTVRTCCSALEMRGLLRFSLKQTPLKGGQPHCAELVRVRSGLTLRAPGMPLSEVYTQKGRGGTEDTGRREGKD